MRIQQTDQILKEAKSARRASAQNEQHNGIFSRAWKALTGLFHRG
jgi:hypothetical protein